MGKEYHPFSAKSSLCRVLLWVNEPCFGYHFFIAEYDA